MKRIRLNLGTKLLLLVSGTVFLSALLQLAALRWMTARQIEHATQDDAHRAGLALSEFLREQRDQLIAQSDLLCKQPALTASIETGDVGTVTDYLKDCLTQVKAEGVEATDDRGKLLGQVLEKKRAQTGTAWSGISARGMASALSGERWAGVTEKQGHLLLVVTIPVKTAGYVKGTFTAFREIDGQVARHFEQTLGVPVAFLVRGKEAGVTDGTGSLGGATVPMTETLSPLRLKNEDYTALYRMFPDTTPDAQLGFVVLRSLSSVRAEYAPFGRLLLWGAGGVLLIALGTGGVVARGITRPLDGFMRAAKILQSGDYPTPFPEIRTDEIGTLQSVFNEMTASLKSNKDRLQAIADSDPLTGLLNHRRFHERLGETVDLHLSQKRLLSLLLIDLDHFHDFNQKWGHVLGDTVLCGIAETLQSTMPGDAIIARYEGETFAVLLPGLDADAAEQVANDAIDRARRSPPPTPDALPVLFSVGVSELDSHTGEGESLLLTAELAVSRAKQLGRGRVCRFEQVTEEGETANAHHLQFALKDGSLDTIQALAAAVDAKDPYTQGHSRRVAEYASALAKFIGLPASEIDLVYTTGTLHDVGKIGVPDSILKKPAKLEDEEREIMETHPVLGEVIIRKAPQLAPTLPGVRHHHERYDGRGYPDKLAGEAIPKIARILAVADTYDAMTSDRPYRKGLSVSIALNEIAKGAGSQFDPELSKAFVEMMLSLSETVPRAA